MTLTDHLRLLRRAWWLVVAAAALGAILAVVVTANTPRLFASSTQLFVSVSGTTTNTAMDVGQGSTAAQQKAKSYAEVVKTSRVLEPVVRELHLPYSTSQLADAVTVTTGTNSATLTISVRDTEASRAAATADAIGTSLREFVTTRLDAAADGQTSLVAVDVLEPASLSHAPVSPRTTVDLGLGLVGGGLVGYLTALARLLLDTKVRDRHSIAEVVDRPVLGAVLHDADAPKRPLTVHLDPRGPRAEAYRTLRTNIQFVNVGQAARVIGVTSALPGEGKTTTTANLAIAFAETGARVAVIDADLRRPRLASTLGLEGAAGLSDVLIGRADLDDVTQPWGGIGLDVVPAGQIPPNASELLGSVRMRALLDELRDRYDYVLLDAPPVLPVTDAAVLSRLTDGTLVAAASGRTLKARLGDAVDTLDQIGSRVIGVVLTMQPRSTSGAYDETYAYPAEPAPGTRTSSGRRAGRSSARSAGRAAGRAAGRRSGHAGPSPRRAAPSRI